MNCELCHTCRSYSLVRVDGMYVCDACRREAFDADGHYLVPVVRGGPWKYGPKYWELWVDGKHEDSCFTGFLMRAGKVHNTQALPGERSPYMQDKPTRPGVEFRAQKGYTGPLPEGCRWADWSEPKPYKVLEGSMDRKTWTELMRSGDLGAVMLAELGTFAQTRTRIIEANGKTRCTDISLVDYAVLYGTDKPKPRPQAPFRVHDRVLVTRKHSDDEGSYGTVNAVSHGAFVEACYRVDVEGSVGAPQGYEASDLELVCRGSDGRDALGLVRRLAKAVAGGDIGEAARIVREAE